MEVWEYLELKKLLSNRTTIPTYDRITIPEQTRLEKLQEEINCDITRLKNLALCFITEEEPDVDEDLGCYITYNTQMVVERK